MEQPTTVDARPRASAELEAALRSFWALDDQVNTLEEQLKDLKAQRKDLGEHQITDLVQQEEVRHSGVRLSDGSEYEFDVRVTCGIRNDDKQFAHQWLEEHNVGHLLKRHLLISFGTNSAKEAQILRGIVARLLPEYELTIKVGKAPDELVAAVTTMAEHAGLLPAIKVEEYTELPGATLSSFVKKCLKAGIDLPPQFGVYAPIVATRVATTSAEAPADVSAD